MNIIPRTKSFFLNTLVFLRESVDDFLFQKSEIAKKLEKFENKDWEPFFYPLEKNGVLTFFSYENPEIQEAIREIKYSRNSRIAESISKFASENLASYIEEKIWSLPTGETKNKKIIFLPIPSHRKRIREKGFNQANDIATLLSKNFSIESEIAKNFLVKTKNTLHQTALSRKERLWNLTDAFEANLPQESVDSYFILVDDVSTTGSTLEEAKKTLKRNGASHVLCFALARSGE